MAEKDSFFYYLAYFYYYSAYLLFMSFIVLFQLAFSFIYNTFNKKFFNLS